MASEHTSNTENLGTPKEGEELTREKLIIKYKTLMALTNKIKTARNEALAENEGLKIKIEAAREKINALTQQHVTAEEMLAALTDQKLKMAMEIDDMKKEKQQYSNMKERANQQAETYHKHNERLVKENNDLLLKLKDKEKNELQLQNDIKKLNENNENVIILCNNIRKEKIVLEKQLDEANAALNNTHDETKSLLDFLAKQFNKHFDNVNCLKQFIESELTAYCKYQCAEEINLLLDKNLSLKNKVDQLNDNISGLMKEKESSETNLFNLTNKLEKLKSELSIVISDRDQILNNLESVRLETKHLIENSEKLSDELEQVKNDKMKNEDEMNELLNNKNNEIECSAKHILQLQQSNEELKYNLQSCREYTTMLERKHCHTFKENLNNTLLTNEVKHSFNDNQPIHEYNSKFLSIINELSEIRNTFSTVSETVQSVCIKLLENRADADESKLVEIVERIDWKTGTEQEYNNCTCTSSNNKCTCFLLQNISTKLQESTRNYEKIISELKNDLDFVIQQYAVSLNKEKINKKLKDEFNFHSNHDRLKCADYEGSKDIEMESILSKVEEYVALNNNLEKKMYMCREELGHALIQLHHAEQLGELMQYEIHSLQTHLSEAVSEKEILNTMVNEKGKIIIKLDEELNAQQSKSYRLISDLEMCKSELNATKNALEAETVKSTQLLENFQNSRSNAGENKSDINIRDSKDLIITNLEHLQNEFIASKQNIVDEQHMKSIKSLTESQNSQTELTKIKNSLKTEENKTKKLVDELQQSQVKFNELKQTLDIEKTKSQKLIIDLKNALDVEQSKSIKLNNDLENSLIEFSRVNQTLKAEQSKLEELISELESYKKELNATKLAFQEERSKYCQLLIVFEKTQKEFNAIKLALEGEKLKSQQLISEYEDSQRELNITKLALDAHQIKSNQSISNYENLQKELNAIKLAYDAEKSKTNQSYCYLESLQKQIDANKLASDVEKSKFDQLLGDFNSSQKELNLVKLAFDAEKSKYDKLFVDFEHSQKELNALKNALDAEQSNSNKLIKDLNDAQNELDETKLSLEEKSKNLQDIKIKYGSIDSRISELASTNQKLVEEKESLKVSVDSIITQNQENWEQREQYNDKLIFDLNTSKQELQIKILNLEKNHKQNFLKFSACVIEIRKEFLKLKQEVSRVQQDYCYYMKTIQQKIEKEIEEQVMAVNIHQETLSKQNQHERVQLLETSLALSKQELATAQLEINQIMEEFHSYRVRAQAQLARRKAELESQKENEAKEQIERLDSELECLRGKMEIVLLEDESLRNRLSTLQSEKEIIDKKYDDISRALHQKIIDYDTLNTEYNAFKLSTDTLIHNGRILLEEKYKDEIISKDTMIKKLKLELKERQTSSQDENITEVFHCAAPSIHCTDEILQEREDGEGSETVAAPFSDKHEFVPLDILINNPVEDEQTQVSLLQEQINMLTAELSSHDIRSKHLSSLLREAEKESARNAQQNTVLKEEVRRLERCLERQPLVANTEYLKNVVFKFFTLQSADERSRLVPVLDSILKLSPSETQKLNEIARGEGSSRWSSYLNSWTGLG